MSLSIINLKPKDNIIFSGKINLKKGMYDSYKLTWLQWTGMYSGLNLYDVTIENTGTIPASTVNPCLISENPPYPNGWTKEQIREYNEKIKDQPCQKLGS